MHTSLRKTGALVGALLLATTAYAVENTSWGQLKSSLDGQPAIAAKPTAGGGGGRDANAICAAFEADLGKAQFQQEFGSKGQCRAMAKLWYYPSDFDSFKSDNGIDHLFCNNPIGAAKIAERPPEEGSFWDHLSGIAGVPITSATECHPIAAEFFNQGP